MRIRLVLLLLAALGATGCDDDEDLLGPGQDEERVFLWESSKPSILGVNSSTGALQAIQPGTATICKFPIRFVGNGNIARDGAPACVLYQVMNDLRIVVIQNNAPAFKPRFAAVKTAAFS